MDGDAFSRFNQSYLFIHNNPLKQCVAVPDELAQGLQNLVKDQTIKSRKAGKAKKGNLKWNLPK